MSTNLKPAALGVALVACALLVGVAKAQIEQQQGQLVDPQVSGVVRIEVTWSSTTLGGQPTTIGPEFIVQDAFGHQTNAQCIRGRINPTVECRQNGVIPARLLVPNAHWAGTDNPPRLAFIDDDPAAARHFCLGAHHRDFDLSESSGTATFTDPDGSTHTGAFSVSRQNEIAGNVGTTPPDPLFGSSCFYTPLLALGGVVAPSRGKTAQVRVVSGVVRYRAPGSTSFVRLVGSKTIPVGSIVDTSAGTVALTTAVDAAGATQTANFSKGEFVLTQSTTAALTALTLTGSSFAACRTGATVRTAGLSARAGASGKSKRVIRQLRGQGSGKFRTKGRYSAATVRGTTWVTQDRCDGTLIKVIQGTVAVRIKRTGKTALVAAGKSLLAPAP